MFRRTLAVLVWLAAALALAPPAHACTLPPPSPSGNLDPAVQRVRSADVAIYGVVSSVRLLDEPAADRPTVGQRFEARVRVTRVFRGMTYRVIRVRGDTDGASCGIGELRPRQRLGLLLKRPSRPFHVSLTSRIALPELLRATRGKWRRPV